MKIGIDCRMYSTQFTGIGRYVFELTQNLFNIDHKNEYVLFFNDHEYTAFQPPNSRITKVLVNARHYSLKEQTHFLKLLNREHLDLMHFTHFNAPLLYRRPSVVTIHDLTLSFYPGKKMTSPLHRLAYHLIINNAVHKAKKVIAVSKNTKKDIEKILKIPAEKIEVIYEGINENFKKLIPSNLVDQTKKKYEIPGSYLLYTGVWRRHKNLPNLIKAFHILKNDYGYDGSLVITGKSDPVYAPEIMEHTQTLQLENDIIFTGLVSEEELIALYKGAQVYVFPSYYEGFGLPPLEAMSVGTPVACSNRSCMPEICGSSPDISSIPGIPTALFFNPDHPKEIASQTFRLISEESLRTTLIQNGLRHITRFEWLKMAKETLALYQKCFLA